MERSLVQIWEWACFLPLRRVGMHSSVSEMRSRRRRAHLSTEASASQKGESKGSCSRPLPEMAGTMYKSRVATGGTSTLTSIPSLHTLDTNIYTA